MNMITVTEDNFKKFAKRLQKNSKDELSLMEAQELLSKTFGASCYHELQKIFNRNENTDFKINVGHTPHNMEPITFSQNTFSKHSIILGSVGERLSFEKHLLNQFKDYQIYIFDGGIIPFSSNEIGTNKRKSRTLNFTSDDENEFNYYDISNAFLSEDHLINFSNAIDFYFCSSIDRKILVDSLISQYRKLISEHSQNSLKTNVSFDFNLKHFLNSLKEESFFNKKMSLILKKYIDKSLYDFVSEEFYSLYGTKPEYTTPSEYKKDIGNLLDRENNNSITVIKTYDEYRSLLILDSFKQEISKSLKQEEHEIKRLVIFKEVKFSRAFSILTAMARSTNTSLIFSYEDLESFKNKNMSQEDFYSMMANISNKFIFDNVIVEPRFCYGVKIYKANYDYYSYTIHVDTEKNNNIHI